MHEGTIKFFDETKGFGFISQSNGGEDIFVHTTGLIDSVRENDDVFEIEQGKRDLLQQTLEGKINTHIL